MHTSVQELTNRAGFVFEGAVRKLGATTATGFDASSRAAVVEVRRILKGPAAFSKFSGKEITVELLEPEGVDRDPHAVFFTNGLRFSDGLVVREVGRLRGEGLEREVHEAMQQEKDERISQRLNQAEMVVAGVAIEVRPFEYPAERRGRVSEHDPEWWECVIEVTTIEKGKKGEKGKAATQVVTLFAHSKDIAWYQSPKFKKGDAGVWLLNRRDHFGKPVPALVTDHPLDFHPVSQLEHIRALLKSAQE